MGHLDKTIVEYESSAKETENGAAWKSLFKALSWMEVFPQESLAELLFGKPTSNQMVRWDFKCWSSFEW